MSFTKIILLKLNSLAPLKERCQFARDLCSNPAINLINKETLIISWLSQQLSIENSVKTSELWKTLHFVLELATKKCNSTKTPLLKTTFTRVILKHADHLANRTFAEIEQLATEVIQCFSSLLLYHPTWQVFRQQPILLLKILTSFLNVINHSLQSGHVPEKLIHESGVQLKHVFESQIFCSVNVLPVVVRNTIGPVLTFFELLSRNDSSCKKEVVVLLTEWLKSVLCNQKLIPSYKQVLQLEEVQGKQDSIKNIESLMKYIEHSLKSERGISVFSVGKLMSLILCAMLEKQFQNSLDLPFELLKYFANLAKTDKSADNIVILNQLLETCVHNSSLLNRSGKITTSVKLNWFKEKCSTVVKNEVHEYTEMLKFLTLLLKINSNTLDHQLESIWRVSWFNIKLEDCEMSTELLCLLLKTYSRLNQLPKLFLKLVACIKELQVLPNNNKTFPRPFVVNFAESVVLLPAGQSLELWKIFLDGCQFGCQSWNCPALIELFSTLLMHIKLTDADFPTSKQSQLEDLLNDTVVFLKTSLQNKSQEQNHDIFFLCYSWGELMITLNLYDFGNVIRIQKPEVQYSSDLFDLSSLHHYLSAEEWESRLKKIKSSDDKANYFVELLLIQKARYSSIICSSDQKKVQHIISQVSSYIFSFIYNQFQEQVSYNSCSTAISWFPLLIPALDCKTLLKFCKPVVRTVLVEDWKSENSLANALMKNSFFSECKSLQTAILTCIWAEAESALLCMKRKGETHLEGDNHFVWKSLSKHPQIWQELSRTTPNDSKELDNEMWQLVFKAAMELQKESQISKSISVDNALRIVQTVCLFPLEDMELGNQIRCILGLLQLLCILKESQDIRKTELHILLCQSLVSLLTKTSASALTSFLDANILLQKLYELLKSSANVEEQKWSLVLLDHIVFILINNNSALEKIEYFAIQLNNQNGSCVFEMQVLKSLIEKLLLLMKRYSLSDNLEIYLNYDKLTSVLVDSLSKHVLSKSDIQENLLWNCLTCIISYHCKNVPDTLQTIKRKPKKILKQHASIVESLLLYRDFSDVEKVKSFYELVGVLCDNILLFEKYLPPNILLGIWYIILEIMKADMMCIPGGSAKKEQSAIAFLIKSMTSLELEEALGCLTKCCDDMITSCDSSVITKFIPLWTILIDVDFSGETPSTMKTGLEMFMNLLLPLLLRPLNKDQEISRGLSILEFVSLVLKKHKVPLKHSQVVMCFQVCSSLKLSTLEPTKVIPLCGVLLTIYKRLLTRTSKIILQSVAPFLSSLSVVLKQLMRAGNRPIFQGYNDSLKKSLVLCSEDFNKLLGLVSNYKKEFSKQAGFLIADYIQEVQNVIVDPAVKEPILLGVYKLLDISGDYVTAMLQISLSSAGREILRQLRTDFNQFYKYRGKV